MSRRILLIASSAVADSMERHVIDALGSMGHSVRHFDIKRLTGFGQRIDYALASALRLVIREPERLRERALLGAVSAFQPELILVLLGSALSPKTVMRLRRNYSGRIVCWCQDQLTTMDRQYLIGAEYDRLFVKDRYMVEFLTAMAGHPHVHYLPEACNPAVHRSVELTAEEREYFGADICTFGTLYYYRQALLQALEGYDLKVWGHVPDWLVHRLGARHMGRPVYEADKCKAVAGAKIVLNTLHYGEINGLNCRAFEAAGCGAFQLMSYSPAAAAHFEPDREVVLFRSRRELIDRIDHYLAHPEESVAIARAAQRRAYAEHTYQHRLGRLLELSI
ncbi:MAG TPA: glycosyltransferase [Steroidobacteraceae bacterium]|nr:glycosyltransferase [Steroidobacteraceae bacterium]